MSTAFQKTSPQRSLLTGAGEPSGAAKPPHGATDLRRQLDEPSPQSRSSSLRERNRRLEEENAALEEKLSRLQRGARQSRGRSPEGGAVAELEKLRRQAQELVDENQALKLTVDRLKERLCRHRSRTPTHEEERRTTELEKELQETQRLHDDAARPGGHSQQECSQLQQLAALVLQENQALVHQLEAHHSRSKAAHENHQCEVSKVSKQLMLAEVENERLQEALQESSRQVKTCQREVQVLKARLEEAVTWEEHCRITGRLNRQREQLESRTQSQLDDLLLRVSSEQKQSGSLARDKAQLAAQVGRLESELERSILSSRTDEARMSVLKRQRRRSQLKEEKSRLYLQAAVAAAEHVSLERDRLLLMASDLQQQRDQFIIRIQSGAVQFGRLEQEVKTDEADKAVHGENINSRCSPFPRGVPEAGDEPTGGAEGGSGGDGSALPGGDAPPAEAAEGKTAGGGEAAAVQPAAAGGAGGGVAGRPQGAAARRLPGSEPGAPEKIGRSGQVWSGPVLLTRLVRFRLPQRWTRESATALC